MGEQVLLDHPDRGNFQILYLISVHPQKNKSVKKPGIPGFFHAAEKNLNFFQKNFKKVLTNPKLCGIILSLHEIPLQNMRGWRNW